MSFPLLSAQQLERFHSVSWRDLQEDLAGIRFGDLTVRLAETAEDIQAAQRLRYRIFYQEMRAQPSPEVARLQRDFDALDKVCDHLLVFDSNRGTGYESVVGTYRLVTRKMAIAHGAFYSANEFDISCLEAFPAEVLELGRSCVDAEYRNGVTMQLLWRGLATYVFAHGIQLMFGCASLPGTDKDELRQALAYLHHYHRAAEEVRPRALQERYVAMDVLAKEDVNVKQVLADLPPLIKGYLRIGACVGDGAVIDWQFNTTDVCIVLNTDLVTDKYIKHYKRSVPGGTMLV
jgi:L-ornithine Nalpha-acyltransferase